MKIWNVVVSVVALVEADTEENAINRLRHEIDKRGLVPMVDDDMGDKYASAFESEPGYEADVKT